jgi:subtilisin family serine protease
MIAPHVLPPPVLLNQKTIVHVEDEDAYEPILRSTCRSHQIGYLRISLLSEALSFIDNEQVAGFIVDLRLPFERPEEFRNWGDFARTSIGLIEKIRRERQELPVVVLTNYYGVDPELQTLLRRNLLSDKDIFRKMAQPDAQSVEEMISRLLARHGDMDVDPDLEYLLVAAQHGFRPRATSSTWEGEVAVLAKVDQLATWRSLKGVRPGIAIPQGNKWIVTGRVEVERLREVHKAKGVLSLEAARLLRYDETPLERLLDRAELTSPFHSGGGGRGVVLGIIDRGCDFAHDSFRHPNGSTRLLALWNQIGGRRGLSEYGALYDSDEINAALGTGAPYSALGYDPGKEAHGTHVMDIAGGSGSGSCQPGIAPEVDLVFVVPSLADVPWEGEKGLDSTAGDSMHLVEALEFIFRSAGERPCVVNVSLGVTLGPHDGTTLVEQAIDALVTVAPNRAVVMAAGNARDRGHHARGSVPEGGAFDLKWRVGSQNGKPMKMEVWYKGDDRFTVELLAPSGKRLGEAKLGDEKFTQKNNPGRLPRVVVKHQHRQRSNGDNVVGVFLGPDADVGEWCLRLKGEQIRDGRFHAWIETGVAPVAHLGVSFVSPDPEYTLNSIACGSESLTVGSCTDRQKTCSASTFSSAGPTRNNRQKPDLIAPGEDISAACSLSTEPILKTGSSMASPQVAGLIACLLAEAHARGRALRSSDIRKLLYSVAQKNPKKSWDSRSGWGCIEGR